MDYSVIVPVYRSADTLPDLCTRLKKVLVSLECTYEIILVDDASPDRSWKVLTELHARNPCIKIVRLKRNFGQHAAILCGLRFAKGDYAITLDDDLQNPPEEIPQLIAAIRDNDSDVVIGVPREKQHALFRRLGSALLNRVTTTIFRVNPDLRMGNFRIMRRDVVDGLLRLDMPEPAINAMLLLLSARIKNVMVRHEPRLSGNSGYTFGKLLRLSYNNVVNFSSLPLQLVSQLGLLSALTSILLLIHFLWKAQSVTVTGWTTIVVLVTFFSGIILFALGIIGEYLVRIIKATNRYPQYVIETSRGTEPGARE